MVDVVYDVRLYRKILGENVREGDIVLEIGPHTGRGSESYIKKTKFTILVDKSIQSEKAMKKILGEHPNARFVKGDARDFKTVKAVLGHIQSCDVFAVDMGGGRFPDTVFKVWATWSGVFKPRYSIIRNRGLAEFIQKIRLPDDSIRQDFPDDGWLSTWGRATPYALKKQLQEFKHWVNVKKPLKQSLK